MADTDEAPAAPATTPATAPPAVRRTRTSIVAGVLAGLAALGFAGWILVRGLDTSVDAAVLVVRGEVVAATVVDVDLDTKPGLPDELVVALRPPYTGHAVIDTRRHDIGVGQVVAVHVDPEDPTNATLVADGWPWSATVDLLFAPMAALGGLALLARAASPATPRDRHADSAGDSAGDTTGDTTGDAAGDTARGAAGRS